MSRRLNQYQRRQEKRRADKISAISTLITIALFGIAYLVIHHRTELNKDGGGSAKVT